MIEVRIGYDSVAKGGSAQWCTFYIEDDFNSFLDFDGDKYYKNQLAPVIYSDRVQEMRNEFISKFENINCIDDLLNNIRGLLYIHDYEDGFEWW